MKTGLVPKILSAALSLVFLGSGFLHPFIHTCTQCSSEVQRIPSVAECCGENLVPELSSPDPSDSIRTIEIFCQICAGMFNFMCPPDSSGFIRNFSEVVFQAAPDSPDSIGDCRLPQTRAPPLS